MRSDHVARHMRVHGGVKKFACAQCNYHTGKSYNLKRHKKLIHWTKENTRAMDDEKIQSGNKKSRFDVKDNKYQCNLCDYGSERRRNVARHMKLIHEKNKNAVGESKIIQDRNGNETPNENVGDNKEGFRKNLMKDSLEEEEKSNLGSKIYIINFNI